MKYVLMQNGRKIEYMITAKEAKCISSNKARRAINRKSIIMDKWNRQILDRARREKSKACLMSITSIDLMDMQLTEAEITNYLKSLGYTVRYKTWYWKRLNTELYNDVRVFEYSVFW